MNTDFSQEIELLKGTRDEDRIGKLSRWRRKQAESLLRGGSRRR